MILGILPNILGFMVAIGLSSSAPALFMSIYTYAWFVGLFVAGIAYLVLSKLLNR